MLPRLQKPAHVSQMGAVMGTGEPQSLLRQQSAGQFLVLFLEQDVWREFGHWISFVSYDSRVEDNVPQSNSCKVGQHPRHGFAQPIHERE